MERNAMLDSGPIPAFVHGLLEYLIGIGLIVAPFALDFKAGAAIAMSVALGIGLLALAASSENPVGMINQVTVPVHVMLDFGVAILAIATPFIFGFTGEGAPTAMFIALGVIHLLVTVGTRFRRPGEPRHRHRAGYRDDLEGPNDRGYARDPGAGRDPVSPGRERGRDRRF